MKYLIILILLLLSTKSNGQELKTNTKEYCSCSSLKYSTYIPCIQDSLPIINHILCEKKNNYTINLSINNNSNILSIDIYKPNIYTEISNKLEELNNFFDNSLSKVDTLYINCFNHKYKLYDIINFKFKNLDYLYIEYNSPKIRKKLNKKKLDKWLVFFTNHQDLTCIINNFPIPLDLAKHIIKTNKNIKILSMPIVEANQDTMLFNLIATHQTQLKYLYLYETINFLPSSFVNMQQLESFALNDISDSLSFMYLKQLPKLTGISINLDLKKDYITTLKYIATLENLEALSIEFNPETISTQIELPQELLALKKLKYLSITGLNICDKRNISSIKILQNLPNLTNLSVSCSNINLLNQEIAKEIAQLINQPMNNDKPDYNKYNPQLSIFFSKKSTEKRVQRKKEMIMQYQKKYFMVNMIGVK